MPCLPAIARRSPPTHPLLQKYRPEIETVARRIQRYFGAPQDIEFAVERDTVYVLQARPITRINFDSEIGEWTNADYRDGGVSSGACTPIMWSLYQFAFQKALVGYLREMKVLDGDFQAARMFFGRPYWNLGAVKRCLAKLPGFVERRFDEDLAIRSAVRGSGPGNAGQPGDADPRAAGDCRHRPAAEPAGGVRSRLSSPAGSTPSIASTTRCPPTSTAAFASWSNRTT